MRGMIYHCYDNVLVTDRKMEGLEVYVGKPVRDSVIQLLVYPWDAEGAPQNAPEGITQDGDYYLVVFPNRVTYQIHKSGKLIRAYTHEPAEVDKTIMDEPMAVVAMCQNKVLLRGGAYSMKKSIFVIVGDLDCGKADRIIKDSTIMLKNSAEGYRGAVRSFPGHEAAQAMGRPWIPTVNGINVLQYSDVEVGKALVVPEEDRENILLQQLVGYDRFSPELQQYVRESQFIKDLCLNVPMFSLTLPGKTLEERASKDELDKMMSVWE